MAKHSHEVLIKKIQASREKNKEYVSKSRLLEEKVINTKLRRQIKALKKHIAVLEKLLHK